MRLAVFGFGVLAAAAAANTIAARADYTVCMGGAGAIACQTGEGALPDPHIRRVPEHDIDVEKDKAWKARCNPTIHIDHYGVSRYSYSHDGCEWGN